MGLFAIVLLLFGFMSTGVTREYICEGTKCVRSGVSCAILVSSCGSQYTSHSRSDCDSGQTPRLNTRAEPIRGLALLS